MLLTLGFIVAFLGQPSTTILNRQLIRAIERNELATVKRSLRQGASPNAHWDSGVRYKSASDIPRTLVNSIGWTQNKPPSALVIALGARALDDPEVALLVRPASNGIVAALLSAGANPNELDPGSGRTPLELAVHTRRLEIVRTLIHNGAMVNLKNRGGHTALMVALLIDGDNRSIVDFLLKSGADPNAVGPDGQCPLSSLRGPHWRQMLKSLISSGAEINAVHNGLTVLARIEKMRNTFLPPDEQMITMMKKMGAHE